MSNRATRNIVYLYGELRFSLQRIMRRSSQNNPKIFAVGFNKTATSSLHELFVQLGLRSYHGVKWRSCNDLRILSQYDCFSDGVPLNLERLDSMFPKSKFILQVRELDDWVYSRLAHIDRELQKGGKSRSSYWEPSEAAIEQWIRHRNEHHSHVLDYFKDRQSDLLVVNFIRDDLAVGRICRFLNFDQIQQKPRKNTNPRRQVDHRHRLMFERVCQRLRIPKSEVRLDILSPSLTSDLCINRHPTDTAFINEI